MGNDCRVSIPNGKPILFRRLYFLWRHSQEILFQSQTGSPSSSDPDTVSVFPHCRGVSIPNGKPILFRPRNAARIHGKRKGVSIPNGKPILFRPSILPRARPVLRRFNPKREAHPLQTPLFPTFPIVFHKFQSQTGSPSSSDAESDGHALS